MSARLLSLPDRVGLLSRAQAQPLLITVGVIGALTTLMLSGRRESWLDLVGAALLLVGASSAILLTAGLVARDLIDGGAQIWLQKPVSPLAFYLARFGEAVLAWSSVLVLASLAARLATGALGWQAEVDLLVALPRIWLSSFVVASIAFGLSPWLVRGASLATLLVWLGGMVLEIELAVRTELLGPATNPLLRAVLFPESALDRVADFAAGTGDAILVPLARILAYALTWIALGSYGVARATGHGGLARAQGD